ncbi:MAG: cation transporter [Bacteroidota bacterium]
MSHIRKPLFGAVAFNAAIVVLEIIAGTQAKSLSLITDGFHNFSDELALVFLYLAYRLHVRLSGNLIRSANLLNSAGLIAISALMIWQAIARVLHPAQVEAPVAIAVGILSALANWQVALFLKKWINHSAAIRLAYLHNMGDVGVSLVPASAGILTLLFHSELFDPLLALGIAGWLIWSTVQEVGASKDELLWPREAVCPHD